jgi:hypothetical protein
MALRGYVPAQPHRQSVFWIKGPHHDSTWPSTPSQISSPALELVRDTDVPGAPTTPLSCAQILKHHMSSEHSFGMSSVASNFPSHMLFQAMLRLPRSCACAELFFSPPKTNLRSIAICKSISHDVVLCGDSARAFTVVFKSCLRRRKVFPRRLPPMAYPPVGTGSEAVVWATRHITGSQT